jgi:hypothetical protein
MAGKLILLIETLESYIYGTRESSTQTKAVTPSFEGRTTASSGESIGGNATTACGADSTRDARETPAASGADSAGVARNTPR